MSFVVLSELSWSYDIIRKGKRWISQRPWQSYKTPSTIVVNAAPIVRCGGGIVNAASAEQGIEAVSSETSTATNHPQTPSLDYPATALQLLSSDDTVFTKATARQGQIKPSLSAAGYLAMANLFLFALRPDPHVGLFARIPRLVWEISILLVAKVATRIISPSLYLLLFIMTITTALMDIFIWAPIYAAFISFETCSGGGYFFSSSSSEYACYFDPFKGISRLAVSMQSIVGGVIYLFTAIQAWNAYTAYRDEQRIHREQRIQRKWYYMNQLGGEGKQMIQVFDKS